jgi:hypothetical protein
MIYIIKSLECNRLFNNIVFCTIISWDVPFEIRDSWSPISLITIVMKVLISCTENPNIFIEVLDELELLIDKKVIFTEPKYGEHPIYFTFVRRIQLSPPGCLSIKVVKSYKLSCILQKPSALSSSLFPSNHL